MIFDDSNQALKLLYTVFLAILIFNCYTPRYEDGGKYYPESFYYSFIAIETTISLP